jgi:hypothetical protein
MDYFTNRAAALFICIYTLLMFPLALDPDLAILSSFAERMLMGYRYTDMYYDTNPPMSMIAYIPAVWISQISGLPIYYAIFVYTTLLMGLCIFLCYRIFNKFEWIDERTRLFITLAFMIIVVMVPGYDYGDRDHPITLGFTLVMLVQIAFLKDIPLSKTIYLPALVIGTFLILVKPHYGLIPAVMLAHRFFTKSGFRVLLQADFIVLTLGVLLYAAVLIVFFDDYLLIAFKDSVKLYASIRVLEVYKFILVLGTLTLVLLAVANSFKQIDKSTVGIINFLGVMTLLLFLPYYVQGKGLSYHKIPAFIYWYMTAGVLIYGFFKTTLPLKYIRPVALLLIIIIVYNVRGVSPSWLTHGQYKALPLLQTVDKYCPQTCNYLVMSDTSDDNFRIESYGGHFHSSRFTSYWFLGFIFHHEYLRKNNLPLKASEEEYKAIVDKYIKMVEYDFENMPADIIIELKTPVIQSDYKFVDYLRSQSSYLDQVFENDYEIVEYLEFDRRLYYPGLSSPVDYKPFATFAVYKRKGFDGYNSKSGPPPISNFNKNKGRQ